MYVFFFTDHSAGGTATPSVKYVLYIKVLILTADVKRKHFITSYMKLMRKLGRGFHREIV